jgi:hypothetical protein
MKRAVIVAACLLGMSALVMAAEVRFSYFMNLIVFF